MKSGSVANRNLVILGIVCVLFLAGCGSGTRQPTINPPFPTSIAVDPAGKFVYVANIECDVAAGGFDCVSMYTVDPTTGSLTSIGAPVSTQDVGVHVVTVDPFGKFAYVTSDGLFDTDGSVVTYTINPTTGALTFTDAIVGLSPAFCCFQSVAVDPFGKFAFVGSAGITSYTIDGTTGALTSIGTISGGSQSVTVDPSGKFAYSASGNDGTGASGNVSMYTINATTGALASIGMIAAGTNPRSVAVDPAGKFVYVANFTSNDVSMYTINTSTGALASIGTVAAGTSPNSVAVHPTGKFAYVTNHNSNDVSMYTINATTGALTPIGTIAAGQSPTSIAVHPSGKFAYVSNGISSDVSIYSIDATTGALTLIGTVGTGT